MLHSLLVIPRYAGCLGTKLAEQLNVTYESRTIPTREQVRPKQYAKSIDPISTSFPQTRHSNRHNRFSSRSWLPLQASFQFCGWINHVASPGRVSLQKDFHPIDAGSHSSRRRLNYILPFLNNKSFVVYTEAQYQLLLQSLSQEQGCAPTS